VGGAGDSGATALDGASDAGHAAADRAASGDASGWTFLAETMTPTPATNHIVRHEGMRLVDDRLVLLLAPTATQADLDSLRARLGNARIISSDPRIGQVLLEINGGITALLAAHELAAADPAVTLATLALLHDTQALPLTGIGPPPSLKWEWRTLDQGSNWGLKDVRAPALWNLRSLLVHQRDHVPALISIEPEMSIHPDLSYVRQPVGRNDTGHGNSVGGMLAAHWDDIGLETVLPAHPSDLPAPIEQLPWQWSQEDHVQALERLFTVLVRARVAGRPAIINLSSGNLWTGRDGAAFFQNLPSTSASRLFDGFGRYWSEWAARVDRYQMWDRWVMTCSAGNSSISASVAATVPSFREHRYHTRTNSGCTNAASVLGNAHFIAVEALARGSDQLAKFSESGGNLAAPGEQLGLLGDNLNYHIGDGTSFASPMVGSTLAVLWTLAPTATLAQIRAAVLAGARPGTNGSAPRLDAFAAARALETAGLTPDLDLWLSDVDDGSIDGTLRRGPTGEMPPKTFVRGDHCVDMRDLRAFRDALLDAAQPTGHGALDGLPGDPRRDQNLDGLVSFTAADPNTTPEARASRYDFDGNGNVDQADLVVMRDAWGKCRNGQAAPYTEGYVAADLDRLLDSVDLWIELLTPSDLHVLRGARLYADPAQLSARMQRGYFHWTVPIDRCDQLEIRIGTSVWLPSSLSPGQDPVVDASNLELPRLTAPLAFIRTGRTLYELAISGTGGSTYVSSPIATGTLGGYLSSPIRRFAKSRPSRT
jgi:hypothetical protein